MLVLLPIKMAQELGGGTGAARKEVNLIVISHAEIQPIVIAGIDHSDQMFVVGVPCNEVEVEGMSEPHRIPRPTTEMVC